VTAPHTQSRLAVVIKTAANLKAQLCELNELGERVRKELLSARESPQATQERLCLWPALEGNGMVVTSGETKQRFTVVVVVAYRVGNDGVGRCFRMGRAEAHLTVLREATMPTRRAMVSTQALLPDKLLVRSS